MIKSELILLGAKIYVSANHVHSYDWVKASPKL